MSSDDSSARPAAPIVLRIKLRYDDVEAMVQRFATNVGKSGLFLPTKSIQPIGTEVKFELRLADDTPALVGLGRVKLSRPPDPSDPKAAFGMAIELMRVTPQSRALILRMLEQRRTLGLPELGLPTPDDIDAARRTEAVAAGTPPIASPIAPPIMPIDAHAAEGLLTAPRRTTGPLATAKVLAVAPLGPEPARRKRVAVSEVIENASGPVASVAIADPGLDDHVDVAAALARARTLAGGGTLEAELEALAEVAAVPLEISIEAASAELARQLGGSAVRRERSARWAPPPATRRPSAADGEREQPTDRRSRTAGDDRADGEHRSEAERRAQGETAAEPELRAGADDAGVDPSGSSENGAERSVEAANGAEPADRAEPIAPADGAEPEAVAVSAEAAVAREEAAPLLARVTGEHDVVHSLSELDMEDVELTERGDIPVPAGFDPQGFAGEPVVDQARLADRLEAQLDEAQAEARAENVELARALGIAAHGDPVGAYEHRAELAARADSAVDVNLDEIDDFEILAEADADDEDLLGSHGEQDASDGGDEIAQQPTGVRRPSGVDFAAQLDLGDDSDLYYAPPGEVDARAAIDRLHEEFADRHVHLDSAGQALAAFDDETGDELDPAARSEHSAIVEPIFEPEPTSSSFTLAGTPAEALDLPPPAPVLQPPPPPPVEPRRPARTPSGPIRKQPSTLRNSPFLPSLLDTPVEDHELESALEALDVDLDDLAIPHAATELLRNHDPNRPRPTTTIRPPSHTRVPQAQPRATQPPSRASVPMPGRTDRHGDVGPAAPAAGRAGAPRATSEDGVVIDFDDDD